MNNARWFILFTTALFCSGFSPEETWVIASESRLAIHGSTNINSFTCAIDSYTGKDTLRYTKKYTGCKLQFTTTRMTIPVRSFDCGSRQISRDFRAALKVEQFPQLDINFIDLENSAGEKPFVNGNVDITIAGVTARYTIRFAIKNSNGTILLAGNHPVNFADFRLQAPEKLNGLIRVENRLNVEFRLVMKSL
jgi:hypothetical protein